MPVPGLSQHAMVPGSWDSFEPSQSWYRSADSLQIHGEYAEETGSHIESKRSSWHDDDVRNIQWYQYATPKAVRTVPHPVSITLQTIIDLSIHNVQARAQELARQKQEEEVARLRDEAHSRDDDSTTPYLPIIVITDDELHASKDKGKQPASDLESNLDEEGRITPDTQLLSDLAYGGIPSCRPPKSEQKKSAFRKLWRKLGRDRVETGESSTSNSMPDILAQIQHEFGQDALAQKVKFPETEVECVSCLDDFLSRDTVKTTCHYYCHDCFLRLVKAAMTNEQQWPPKCCHNPIDTKLVQEFIPLDMRIQFRQRAQEMAVPVSERLYCHKADCGLWIRPETATSKLRRASCRKGHWTCTMCRGPTHRTPECPNDHSMDLTNQLAEEEGWKRCYNCFAMVEHREACQHMTCRCGAQFCYVCGQRWRTCHCSMEQLYDLKNAASRRREERQMREAAEDAELQLILRQIEQFEREEALKAELLRQERERQEAERLQRELEYRVWFESIRRKDIERKYQELQISLEELNDLQQILFEVQHDEQVRDLAASAEQSRAELLTKHQADKALEELERHTKLQRKEQQLMHNYLARTKKEKAIEDQFYQQLATFYADDPDVEVKLEEQMLPLRRRMDKGHRAWQKWKDEVIEKYRSRLEDQRTTLEEILCSAECRFEDKLFLQERELAKKLVAEKTWIGEIAQERLRLLASMQHEEVEGDADSLFAERRAIPGLSIVECDSENEDTEQ